MTYMLDLLPVVMYTSNRIVVYSVINLVPRAHGRIAPCGRVTKTCLWSPSQGISRAWHLGRGWEETVQLYENVHWSTMIFQRNGVKIKSAISESKKIFMSTCKINISAREIIHSIFSAQDRNSLALLKVDDDYSPNNRYAIVKVFDGS